MRCSPRAREYALSLAAERDIPPVTRQTPTDTAENILTLRRLQSDAWTEGYVSGRQCSALIDWLKYSVARRDVAASAAAKAAGVGPGTYLLEGTVWIVTERSNGNGVYARQLVERQDGDGKTLLDLGRFDRAKSVAVLGVLTPAHHMTFAAAKDRMVRYGRCFAQCGRGICARELSADESVAVAMGPVCGPKFPGYAEAIEEYRAGKKHALYEQAREQLGLVMSDVDLYRAAGPQVSTVAGIERKLDSIPA